MNRKTLIVSLLIIAGTLILMGTTYAYFTAMATSSEQKVQSGVLSLTYDSGQDIFLENAFPGEEKDAGIHQFAIENTGTLDATYYLYLDKCRFNLINQLNKVDLRNTTIILCTFLCRILLKRKKKIIQITFFQLYFIPIFECF